MCYYKDAEMHILVSEVKKMSVDGVLAIIQSFFDAIVKVFQNLMGLLGGEGTTEAPKA